METRADKIRAKVELLKSGHGQQVLNWIDTIVTPKLVSNLGSEVTVYNSPEGVPKDVTKQILNQEGFSVKYHYDDYPCGGTPYWKISLPPCIE